MSNYWKSIHQTETIKEKIFSPPTLTKYTFIRMRPGFFRVLCLLQALCHPLELTQGEPATVQDIGFELLSFTMMAWSLPMWTLPSVSVPSMPNRGPSLGLGVHKRTNMG